MSKTNECPRCKGEGTIKHYGHVVAGLCFKCYGCGVTDKELVAAHKAVYYGEQAKAKELTKEEHIEELKYQVVHAYYFTEVEPSRFQAANKQRKAEAQKVYSQLVNEYGVKMTLEEIKKLSDKYFTCEYI